jgi:radical SAM protein with 4Fe4S-binding SPASM domain
MVGSNDPARVKESAGNELTTAEIEEYILKSALETGIDTITWSGGEFVLRKDAEALIRKATEYGYLSIITTNGVHMDRERLLRLKEASSGTVVIAVGINSIDEKNTETRDADCGISLKVLEMCKELGIRKNVVVTIGAHNLDTLASTLKWLDDNQIPYNRSPYVPRGSGKRHWRKYGFNREHMEKVIHPELRKHALGYISYTPFFLSPELHEKYSKGVKNVTVPQNPPIGCWCGTWLSVNAEGEVSPCAVLTDEVNCGNVRDKSFQQIIDDSPVFQQLLDRTGLKGKCGRCRYKYTCGGCRALAYYKTGDIMDEDPTCFFEPEDEHTVCVHEEETNKTFKQFAIMSRYIQQISKTKRKYAGLKST